jgi:hypothetical protein
MAVAERPRTMDNFSMRGGARHFLRAVCPAPLAASSGSRGYSPTVRLALLALMLAPLMLGTSGAGNAAGGDAPGLVAAYSFDEGSGTSAADTSGKGNTGSIVGASWAATGRFGSALSFDGASSRVDLPALGTFYKTGFTYEAWVRKQASKLDAAIVGTWVFGSQGGPMMWVDHVAGDYYLTLNQDGLSTYLDSGRQPLVGQWQHVAVTYDGSVARFYVDGSQAASRPFAGNVGDSNTWRIGAYGASPGGFFDGLIDEVRIYNRAITAAQIQNDMARPVAVADTAPPSAPANFASTGSNASSLSVSWSPSTDDVGVAGYNVYRGGNRVAQLGDQASSYTFTGLTCGTTHALAVEAFDDVGNVSPQATITASTAACDVTPPVVAISSPQAGASVTGAVTVAATASDNDRVAGVQFRLDGNLLGNEDTAVPYTTSWSTLATANGTHTLTATARDASGNVGASSPVTITVSNPAPPPGLVAAYSFDDASGTTAADSSGRGNNGVIAGASWAAAGRFGSALSFDGTGSRVDLPALGTFYKTAFTYEAWVYKGSSKLDAAVVGTWTPSGQGGPMLWVDHVVGDYYLTLNQGGLSTYLDSGRKPLVGQWQHVAVTYDGSTARIYVDGTEVASKAFSGNVGDSNVWRIGAYGASPAGFFDGLIDEVRIYKQALTASQIQTDLGRPISLADAWPPAVTSVSPANGATNVSVGTSVKAVFSEPVQPSTVNGTTIDVRDAANNLVPANVTYDASADTATLTSGAIVYGKTYTVTVHGGTSGSRVLDLAGNALAADVRWSFTMESPPPPVAVVASAANPFSSYLGEILKAEGMNEFITIGPSLLSPQVLSFFDTVLVGDLPLTADQASVLNDWVNAGGNLVAMRPDKKLAGLLGLVDTGTTLANAYLDVDTSVPAGAGIVSQTIQFHGTADQYTLNGATAVATLYTNATSPTTYPAVTMRSVGSNGGEAAAFTYDLARSVVYTRQGNPAWAGQDRDGVAPIQSDDLFYGAKTGDVQRDWVDMSKVAIPQADEQQRLLVNVIERMAQDRKPLPRLWYLPRGKKAAIVMTGDDHAAGGTAGRFDAYKAASPAGCSVANWECVRSTSYIYPSSPLTDAQARSYIADGFEVAVHTFQDTNCALANYTYSSLDGRFTSQLGGFAANYPSAPAPTTDRTHCPPWSDWLSQPRVELAHGIRLDLNYYYYPSIFVQNRPGMFTGSGFPMRFADTDGSSVDVYQAATQMTDQSGQTYPSTVDTLLDKALGSAGYYGAFVANMHTDDVASAGSDAIVASALSRSVPIVSARQLLDFWDARDKTTFRGFSWGGGILSFTLTVANGATGLQAMLPMQSDAGTLRKVTRGGSNVTFTKSKIKGLDYAFFTASSGSYQASYS